MAGNMPLTMPTNPRMVVEARVVESMDEADVAFGAVFEEGVAQGERSYRPGNHIGEHHAGEASE